MKRGLQKKLWRNGSEIWGLNNLDMRTRRACLARKINLPCVDWSFCIAFLIHFFVTGRGVLVAGIVCYALGGRRIMEHPSQLIGNFKIGVRIQMPIGFRGCLYFFMSQTLFDQQGIFAHTDEQGDIGILQCDNTSAWILMRCTPASSAITTTTTNSCCAFVFGLLQ